ncbi:hypothetical protein KI387_020650, partial [Taxus chinensis]
CDGKETIFSKDKIQLKTNTMPRGLVALDSNIDNSDMVVQKNILASRDVEEHNLGMEEKPKKIWLG